MTTHLIIRNLLTQNSFRNNFLKESKVIVEREREGEREGEREERELINYLSAKRPEGNTCL